VAARLPFLRRLTADARALDAEELEAEVRDACSTRLADLCRGELVTVGGRLRTVVYTPRETLPVLSAELFDGTGTIDLVWLGRRRIAGLSPGRKVLVRGRVGVHDGKLAMYNPVYELRASG
jgi:RecG-like helicase